MRLIRQVLKSLIIGCLYVLPLLVHSQSRLDTTRTYKFTFSPSALVNTFPGIQLGIERRILPTTFLELEGAYLVGSTQTSVDLNEKGYRLKLAYKVQNANSHTKTTITFFNRKIFADRVENFSRFDDLFFEQISFRKTKTLYGFTIGALRDFELDHFVIQVGFAVGPGLYYVKDIGVPENADQVSGIPLFGIYERAGRYRYPIISAQFKFLF